ncbi:hypothetical protein MRX96_003257 [Rhipicephalus microplus]
MSSQKCDCSPIYTEFNKSRKRRAEESRTLYANSRNSKAEVRPPAPRCNASAVPADIRPRYTVRIEKRRCHFDPALQSETTGQPCSASATTQRRHLVRSALTYESRRPSTCRGACASTLCHTHLYVRELYRHSSKMPTRSLFSSSGAKAKLEL